MKLRIGLFVLLLAVAGTAGAQSAREMRNQAEASMVVTGHVDIEADGTVSGYEIDHRADLPDFVTELIDRRAPAWTFEPYLVNGAPVRARAAMSLRVVASPIEGSERYQLAIVNGSFGSTELQDSDVTVGKELRRPVYPEQLNASRIGGTVYLLVKVGRDGRVEDTAVERVNLTRYSDARSMDRVSRMLALSTTQAASRWTFVPPSTGDMVNDPYWVLRVPVDFRPYDAQEPVAGTWEVYVPGPTMPPPAWLPEHHSAGSDAMLAGQTQMLGTERQLLTPLDG